MRRPLAVLGSAVVALGLAACTRVVDGSPEAPGFPSASAPGTAAIGSPASFSDCSALLQLKGVKIASDLQGKLTAECAQVPVPLDYDDPGGARVEIPLVRIHDGDNAGETPLLLNPGGPGGSGVQLVLGIIAKMSADVLEHYDLVGFDPRGVSLSRPAISCLTDDEKDAFTAASPDVTTSTGFATAKQLAQQFAADCAASTPGIQFYDTVNTAKDLDVLRKVLGQQTTNYLGYSYGTELGSVYAHLYPDRVGAMVLDGAVDPLTSGISQSTFQLAGFEKAYGQFASYCRETEPCSGIGDPVQAAKDIENAAYEDPLPTSTSRKLTANLAVTGIQSALYSRTEWKKLGTALVHAQAGDGTDLLALADEYNQRMTSGQYTNLMDAFNVISCNDTAPGPTDDQVRRTIDDWATRYPLFGKNYAAGLFACQSWQSDRTVPPKPTAPTPHGVLVVGNVHDPATPYQGAIDLAKTMGNAEVLSWDGQGHTSYLNGSKCVDRYVNRYLVTQQLPPDDTTCPA